MRRAMRGPYGDPPAEARVTFSSATSAVPASSSRTPLTRYQRLDQPLPFGRVDQIGAEQPAVHRSHQVPGESGAGHRARPGHRERRAIGGPPPTPDHGDQRGPDGDGRGGQVVAHRAARGEHPVAGGQPLGHPHDGLVEVAEEPVREAGPRRHRQRPDPPQRPRSGSWRAGRTEVDGLPGPGTQRAARRTTRPTAVARGLDRARPVVPPDPTDRVGCGVPGQHGHAGEHGTGPTGAAAAGHLDPLTRARPMVGRRDRRRGPGTVPRGAEVGPVDPFGRPVQVQPGDGRPG